MGSEADRKASPAGFPLRCPDGQTGPKPSIEEMPRPPSEQGTSSLPGLATDNIGYQTASSGSDEAVTGLLERYSGGHRPQHHTVATVASASHLYSHSASLNSRQPPALPPGAPTAAAQGLTHVYYTSALRNPPTSQLRFVQDLSYKTTSSFCTVAWQLVRSRGPSAIAELLVSINWSTVDFNWYHFTSAYSQILKRK